MLDKIHEIEMRRRAEASMTLKLLALVFIKPLITHTEFPEWPNCLHIDMKVDNEWPDTERELIPMLNSLVGSLIHKVREPIDICILRRDGLFCICVRYK